VIKVQPKKIYWFFIYPLAAIIFALICTAFILSARGYTLSIEGNAVKIEKTGMIIISTKPFGANIILNGKQTSKNTSQFFSTKLNNLGKNKYILNLEKDGYYTWEKELHVFPEMVTWANYVLLFSKNPKIEKVDFIGSLVESLASYDNKYQSILMKDKSGEVIYILNNSTGEKTVLLETAKLAADKKITDIKFVDWSKDRRYLLITGIVKGEKQYLAVNTESKSIETLNALFPNRFDRLSFNTANSDEIYGIQNNEIFRLSIRNKTITNALEKNIVYFTLSAEEKLYYIKDTTGARSLWQANSDFSGKTSLSDAMPVSDKYEIKVSPKDKKIAIYTKNNTSLYMLSKSENKSSLITMGKDIVDFSWSPHDDRFFYKSANNMFVFEIDDYKKESIEYVIAGASDYKNVVWYDDRHLLAQKGDRVAVMDFDGSNEVVLGDTVGDIKPFFSSDNKDILFFAKVSPDQTLLSRYKVEF